MLEIPRFPNTSNSRKAREYSSTEYNRVLLSLWFWKFNQCKLYWGYFAWRTEGMKKKERISEPIHFQFRDLSSSARCWHYSCSIFLLLFFGIEESSFSIQTNFLSHSQLGMIWLGLGSSSRARSVEMGGIFLGICLSLAAASRVELKGYEKEAPSIWPMRCKCQFSTP